MSECFGIFWYNKINTFYHNNLHTNIYTDTEGIFGARIQFHSFAMLFLCFVRSAQFGCCFCYDICIMDLLNMHIMGYILRFWRKKWGRNKNRIRTRENVIIIQVICCKNIYVFHFPLFISTWWNSTFVFGITYNVLSHLCVWIFVILFQFHLN